MNTIEPTLQALYTNLRSKAFQDPVMRALFNHEIMWADVVDEYATSADQLLSDSNNQLMEAIRREMKLSSMDDSDDDVPTMKVRFQEPVDHVESVVSLHKAALPIYNDVLFNPRQIKTVITRNLPRDITQNELSIIFEKYGPIRDIYIPRNTDKSSPYFGSIKGFALIKYLSSTDSTRAVMSETNRLYIRGKQIGIEYAKEDR